MDSKYKELDNKREKKVKWRNLNLKRKDLKITERRGCRDGSVVRSTGRSLRRSSLNSQLPHSDSHNSSPGHLTPSSVLLGHCMYLVHRQMQANIHTRNIKWDY